MPYTREQQKALYAQGKGHLVEKYHNDGGLVDYLQDGSRLYSAAEVMELVNAGVKQPPADMSNPNRLYEAWDMKERGVWAHGWDYLKGLFGSGLEVIDDYWNTYIDSKAGNIALQTEGQVESEDLHTDVGSTLADLIGANEALSRLEEAGIDTSEVKFLGEFFVDPLALVGAPFAVAKFFGKLAKLKKAQGLSAIPDDVAAEAKHLGLRIYCKTPNYNDGGLVYFAKGSECIPAVEVESIADLLANYTPSPRARLLKSDVYVWETEVGRWLPVPNPSSELMALLTGKGQQRIRNASNTAINKGEPDIIRGEPATVAFVRKGEGPPADELHMTKGERTAIPKKAERIRRLRIGLEEYVRKNTIANLTDKEVMEAAYAIDQMDMTDIVKMSKEQLEELIDYVFDTKFNGDIEAWDAATSDPDNLIHTGAYVHGNSRVIGEKISDARQAEIRDYAPALSDNLDIMYGTDDNFLSGINPGAPGWWLVKEIDRDYVSGMKNLRVNFQGTPPPDFWPVWNKHVKNADWNGLIELRSMWMGPQEKAAFNQLPDRVRVYRVRGETRIHDQHPDSFSWTVNRKGLITQAERLDINPDTATIETGWVNKNNIAGVFMDTGESEIIAAPKYIKGKQSMEMFQFEEQDLFFNPDKNYYDGGYVSNQ